MISSARLIPACAGTTHSGHDHTIGNPAHPRLRGDHRPLGIPPQISRGSSPPARGPLNRPVPTTSPIRLIPACAGTTSAAHLAVWYFGAHPRLRGDHPLFYVSLLLAPGSSPPARGPLRVRLDGDSEPRLIPACAGTTSRSAYHPHLGRAHPRLRGDHTHISLMGNSHPGSSPPARGPPDWKGPKPLDRGLIPACAGTTADRPGGSRHAPAHPRLRGDHSSGAFTKKPCSGSSPPARGPPTMQA